MKKVLLVSLAVGLVLAFSSFAMAIDLTPGHGINGTYHDLSSLGAGNASGDSVDQASGTGLNRICIYCHAPHNTLPADTGLNTYRPLWNHNPSTNTTFKMYSNGTDIPVLAGANVSHNSQAMDLLAGVNAPGSVSMLCLSCHDGTTATNSYGYASNSAPGKGQADNFMTARATIGGGANQLSNHHPIGFSYDLAQANDNELALSSSGGYLLAGTGAVKNGGPTTIAELLWNGNVECISCHDVHNTKNGGSKFTWIEDKQSALCLTCKSDRSHVVL